MNADISLMQALAHLSGAELAAAFGIGVVFGAAVYAVFWITMGR